MLLYASIATLKLQGAESIRYKRRYMTGVRSACWCVNYGINEIRD